MKRKAKFLGVVLTSLLIANVYAQQNPTGGCLGTFPSNPSNSTRAWLRGGNNNSGGGGSDNIFGTCFNSPIYTITSSTLRTWLNGTFTGPVGPTAQPNINGTGWVNGVNTSGYFGIGFSGPLSPLQPGVGTGPWTLLHLQGPNNTGFPAGGSGWRTWMKTGTLTVENTDALYVGLKSEGFNHSDAIINWSDDLYIVSQS